MTAFSRIEIECPRCHEDVRYRGDTEDWVGGDDDSTRCRRGGGDLAGGHKEAIEGALVYALTMNGINGLLRKLAGRI